MADVGDRERIEEVAAVPRTPVVPDERRPQLSQPPPNDAAGLGAATAGGLAAQYGAWNGGLPGDRPHDVVGF